MPGVSISSPPLGSAKISRWVVVCRPARIELADSLHALHLAAQVTIGQLAICRPGRTDEHGRYARTQTRAELFRPRRPAR